MPAKKSAKIEKGDIPRKTVYRLSIYSRCLQRLLENGIKTVSSEALAGAAGVKSPQLRKDLTYFGQFGTRGLGYDVEQLIKMISDLLVYGRDNTDKVTLTLFLQFKGSQGSTADITYSLKSGDSEVDSVSETLDDPCTGGTFGTSSCSWTSSIVDFNFTGSQ